MAAPRKNPILLRKGAFSGHIEALTNYRHVTRNGRSVIRVANDGKHDVTADFDTLMLEELMPDPKSTIVAELDGAARGMELTKAERKVIAEFRERLVAVIERHNARLPPALPPAPFYCPYCGTTPCQNLGREHGTHER